MHILLLNNSFPQTNKLSFCHILQLVPLANIIVSDTHESIWLFLSSNQIEVNQKYDKKYDKSILTPLSDQFYCRKAMGGGHACERLNQSIQKIAALQVRQEVALSKWKEKVERENKIRPDILITDIKISLGNNAHSQIQQQLRRNIDPTSEIFRFVNGQFMTALDSQAFQHKNQEYKQGYYLACTGMGILRVNYYLRTFSVEANETLTNTPQTVVSYGYALSRYQENVDFKAIGQICETFNCVDLKQKFNVASQLSKHILHKKSTEELKVILKQRQLIKQVKNPFGN